MANVRGIIVAAAALVALVTGGLWLRGYKQRLKTEGALAEAMKAATAQRTADSLALQAAQDTVRARDRALVQSADSVALWAGKWQALRNSAPVQALATFSNPPAPDAGGMVLVHEDTLRRVARYVARLEFTGDSLKRSADSLRMDALTIRTAYARAQTAAEAEKADIQRQLAIAIAQARKTQPGAASRWTRNAGIFLAGVGTGLVLERIRQ